MSNRSFYEIFGKLANAFAWLEGDIRRLIAGIAFQDDLITASAFLDSSQLRNNLKLLRKLGRQYPTHEEHFKNLTSSVDKLADRRNLFIHGIWTAHTFCEENGFALVRDLKTRYTSSDNSRTWASGQAEKITFLDFKTLLSEIRDLTYQIDLLMKILEKYEELKFNGHSNIFTKFEDHLFNIKD